MRSLRHPLGIVAVLLVAAALALPGRAAADASTDTYIVAKAAALGHDPAQLFAFVRDHVAFEGYFGYVRGARGALWSGGANSLDRSALLIALLQASGVTNVRYAHAVLGGGEYATLVTQMLALPNRVFGCQTAGGYSPLGDGQLFGDVRDHYWVQFDGGGGFVDADTSIPTFALGDTLLAPTDTFTDVPANIRYQATITLSVETFSQASAAFSGTGLGTTTVLTQSFDAADLVGKPLSVSAFVRSASGGAGPFSVTTNTYTPYVLVGQGDADVSDDPIVVGSDFQDVFTNFPLGSQIVTSLVVGVDLRQFPPNGFAQHFERRVFDRLGFVARQGGGPVSISPSSDPAITDFDVTTVNVLPGLVSLDAFGPQHDRLNAVTQQLTALEPALAAITPGGPYTPDQQALLRQASSLSRSLAIVNAETLTMSYDATADFADRQLARGYLVKPIVATPRLTLGISQKHGDGASLELDVLKNDLRIIPLTGQNQNTPFWFDVARGLEESFLEGSVIAAVSGQPAVSIREVLEAAVASPANDLAVITTDDLDTLATLAISDEAKARIAADAGAGKIIITPTAPVTVGGQTTIGWLETDQFGHTISVFEHGGHQALVQYGNALEFSEEFNKPIAMFIGHVAAFGTVGIAYTAAVLDAVATGGGFDGVVKNTKESIDALVKQAEAEKGIFDKLEKAFDKLKLDTKGFGLLGALADGLIKGFEFAKDFFDYTTPNDPPAFPFLVNDLGSGPPPVTPNAQPGVTVQVVPDPLFTVDAGGGVQVPDAFIARITNTGPAADTFTFTFPTPPPGFQVRLTRSSLTLAPGETGELSLCLFPNSPAPPGTPAGFMLEATSVSSPSVNDTASSAFTVPATPGVMVTTDPAEVTTAPGGQVMVTLGLRSIGNVAPGDVDLALVVPAGVTPGGLVTPVTLGAPDAIAAQPITFTLDPGIAPNTDLIVRLEASFGPQAARQTVDTDLVIHAVSVQATCAGDAAPIATRIGRTGLGDVLGSLAGAIDALGADPGNAVQLATALAFTDKTIAQIDMVPSFAAAETEIQAARAALAAALPAQVAGALAQLNAGLCDLKAVLASADNSAFQLFLTPEVQQLLPNSTATFQLTVFNGAPSTRTFDLALSGLPAGVTGHVSPQTLTIGPGQNFPTATVTIDPVATELAPFDFMVTATDALAPLQTNSITGSLSVRNELVQVVDVTATPAFVDPGAQTTVHVRLYNAVNRVRDVDVFVSMNNALGQNVIFNFFGGTLHLDLSASVKTLDVPLTIPANFPTGPYTLIADVFDANPFGQIPGATGMGPFFVGAPLAADVTVSPQVAAPGDVTVQTTVTLQRDAVPNPTATLVGAVGTNGGVAHSVAPNGTVAYVCAEHSADVVDVGDPTSPHVVRTFADTLLSSGYTSDGCTLFAGRLVMGFSRGFGPGGSNQPTTVAVFDLTDPTNPSLVSSTPFNRGIGAGPTFYDGSIGWVPTGIFIFNPFSNFIFRQDGDVFGVDLTNLASPTLRGRLFPPSTPPGQDPTADYAGGNQSMIFHAIEVSGHTSYVATTTATGDGFGTGPGVARVLVADVTDPDNPAVTGDVRVPEAVLGLSLAQDGTTVLLASDSVGFYDAASGLTGQLVLSALDATDPAHPTVKSTLVTQLKDHSGPVALALGNGIFAVGGTKRGTQDVLALVDATDPTALRFIPYDVETTIDSMRKVGNLIYTTSADGLAIYRVDQVNGPRLTVRVQVPTTTGVTLVPGSFNVQPNQILSGATSDTYVWDQPLGDTLTWQQTAHGLAVGETRAVVLGGEADFVLPTFGSGKLVLGPAFVEGTQILAVSPTALTNVQVATPAAYTLTVSNPTASPVTYALSVAGVPADWVALVPTVDVPANGTVMVPLVLTSDLAATPYRNFDFSVSADGGPTLHGDAFALLGLGPPPNLGANFGAATGGVTLDLIPPVVTTGPGGVASFTARVTNIGNVPDNYSLQALTLPPNWGGNVLPGAIFNELPGPDNAREVTLELFPPGNQLAPAPGIYDVPISVFSNFGNLGVRATAHVNIVGPGVQLGLNPNPGTPATTFQLTVRNTGTAADTFDLSVGGLLALGATLGTNSLPLGPGEQQNVPLTLGALPLALPGLVPLEATAAAHTVPAVTATARTFVNVGSARGLTVGLAPAEQDLGAPGGATFILQVENTGNVNDSFVATITGTTGGVTAALKGLDGLPAQSVPQFFLPAFGTGTFPLDASLAASGEGTVTVQVASLGDPSQMGGATATLKVAPTTTTTTTTTTSTASTTTLPRREICDNCIDDDGDGLVDRDDPDCPARANGDGRGLGDPAHRGHAAARCEAAIKKAAGKFVARKLKSLAKCTDAAFGCVQQQPTSATCLGGARRTCGAELPKIDAQETKARLAIAKMCGAKTAGAAPQVPLADLLDVTGLGYAAEQAPCADVGVPALDSFDAILDCVFRQHECRAEQLLSRETPRARELLGLLGVSPGTFSCLDAGADGGGQGLGARGRAAAAVKCQSTIEKAGATFVRKAEQALQKCADAVFGCIQQRPGDAACLTKAHATCAQQTGKISGGTQSLDVRLHQSIASACGPKQAGQPPLVPLADLLAPTGLGWDAAVEACAGLGVPTIDSADAAAECLVRYDECRVHQLLEREVPRAAELLELGGVTPTAFPRR